MKQTDAAHGLLLSSDDVVERLAAKPALRRAAVRCVLTAIRSGGLWRFRQSELDAWIERQILSDASEGDSTDPFETETTAGANDIDKDSHAAPDRRRARRLRHAGARGDGVRHDPH